MSRPWGQSFFGRANVTRREIISLLSMFLNKHREKFRLVEKSPTRIPTRWKFVIAGLIGTGTGLLMLTMWSSGSKDDLTIEENSKFLKGVSSEFQRNVKTTPGCKIGGCKTVTCSAISESENPGRFASDFVTEKLAVQCPMTTVIELLEFQSCTFPNKKLDIDWLTMKLPIAKLSFVNCGLEDLPKGSFSSSIYSDLRSLMITNARVKVLKKWIFEELVNLKQFLLADNTVEQADMNLLSTVADSLEDLGLEASLKDLNVLENITGRVSLTKVKNLYLRRNFLGTINSETFKSLPNVVAIYLEGSSIDEMHVDALKSTRSLELLDLNDNLLTTLPRGIFTSVLSKNPGFQLSMSNNPWHCSCDLEWFMDLIETNPEILMEIPKCETPERNALLYFTSAKFCDYSNSNVTTTVETTTRKNDSSENDEKIVNYVKFTCENDENVRVSPRKLLATEEWKFPSRHQDFSLRPLANGDLKINLKLIDDQPVWLIWFENDAMSNNSNTMTDKIDCLRNIRGPVLLKNLAFNSSYTICLLENLEVLPSPLNCLAARTSSTNALTRSNVWLTNEDKSVVISVAITFFLIVSLLSAVSSFFLIRRNPSLLRGSKRILMVKKHGVDALVMPKGITRASTFNPSSAIENETIKKWSNEKCLRKNHDSNYLKPLKNQNSLLDRKCSIPTLSPRRKDSKISRIGSFYSTGSYVSGIEATSSELYNWRNTLISKNLYTACIEDEEFYGTPSAPPPPPLPHRALNPLVPSLSLTVDSHDRSDTFAHF